MRSACAQCNSPPSSTTTFEQEDLADIHDALVLGVRDYAQKTGFRKALLGLSGGIDSALTAVIAAEALGPKNVIGVSLPSEISSQHSKDDARILAENLGIEYHTIGIAGVVAAAEQSLAPIFAGRPRDIAEENIQARARGLLLMAISNKSGALLLTTGNKSELAVGYCTLYGDMCGGLAVISDVFKMQVYALSRWINRGPRRSSPHPASRKHPAPNCVRTRPTRTVSRPTICSTPSSKATSRPAFPAPTSSRTVSMRPSSTTSPAKSTSTNTSASKPPPA